MRGCLLLACGSVLVQMGGTAARAADTTPDLPLLAFASAVAPATDPYLLAFAPANLAAVGDPNRLASGAGDVSTADASSQASSSGDDQSKSRLSESPKPPVTQARDKSRLSESPKPLLKEHKDLPERNPPIFEWNLPFLGPGNIISGFKSPTGAVWQPAFWGFGDFIATAGYANNGVNPGQSYISSRADLFGNLQLTPTERVVVGFTPLSLGSARGTGFLHTDGDGTQFYNGLDANVRTLFFEGDTRQLFPGIDPDDRLGRDYGFAVGRQPIFFQEGIMIDDNIQALGITKDTIQIPGITQDMRITGVYGWADIRRGNNLVDPTAYLLGIFTETDLRKSVVTFDFSYIGSDNPPDISGVRQGGSGVYFGASATQRFGDINTAFRVNTSTALDGTGTAVDNGALLLGEFSRTVTGSTDLVYANVFETIGHYTSAARSTDAGGPLERVGIMFTPPAAGLVGSPISGYADHVYGGALGYQMFFGPRKQLTLELAGENDTNGSKQGVVGIEGQYLQAITSRTSIQFNAFLLDGESGHVGSGVSVESRTRW